jgi:O-antigen/teichoic acid export membrane protein
MTDDVDKIKNIFTRFKGLTTLGLASIISNVIAGLFWLYLARLLGTVHYGEVSYFIAISGIGTIISFFGAGNTLTVYTAKDVKIQATIYFISLVASAIIGIILYFIFNNISVSLYVIGNVIFGLVTSELLGRKLYKKYSIYLITEKVLATVLAIFLYHIIGPNGVILGIALSFFSYSITIYQGFQGSKIDFSLIKSRLGFIINSYILDIARTFSTTADKLIIAPMLGFALLGNYQLGAQFLSVLGIIPGIAYNYMLPHDASGNPNKKLKKITMIIAVILALLGVTLSPIILPILFPKFVEAVEVIQIVSLSIIPATINLTYISKFLGKEKSKIVLFGSIIYILVQISTIIILGKIWSVNGVAMSLVIAATSETIYLISVNHITQKKLAKF